MVPVLHLPVFKVVIISLTFLRKQAQKKNVKSVDCKTGSFVSDPWLHRKAKKNAKNKSRVESSLATDPSYNALAAAGLKVGTLAWSLPQRTKPPNGLSSPAMGKHLMTDMRTCM